MIVNIDVNKIREMVAFQCNQRKIPGSAIEPLVFVIVNHWSRHENLDYWRHREALLVDPEPCTLVVKEVFEKLQSTYAKAPADRQKKEDSEHRSTGTPEQVQAEELPAPYP